MMKKYYLKLKKSVETRGIVHTVKEIWKQTIEAKIKNTQIIKSFDSTDTKYGLNEEQRIEKVVVSLTTIPSRIEKTIFVIDTLLKQSMKPDAVVLYIGRTEFNNKKLPNEFNNLQKRGLEIKFVKDIGPHTKYFYAMQEYSGAIIITVDDDRIYDKYLVEKFYNAYKLYPGCISASWVKKITFKNGSLLSHELWPRVVEEGVPSKFNFALGVDGVLYPPNLLPKETFNEEQIRNLSLYADDVWLKGMELINNIPVVKVPGSGDSVNVNVSGTQIDALNQSNEGDDKNSIYIKNVAETYNLFEKLQD